MIRWIAKKVLTRGEKRIGVKLDYARMILSTNLRLFMRFGKVFGFLDPNVHVPPAAYHAARICGARTADCGTCVEAEINLARLAGMEDTLIQTILACNLDQLPADLVPVVRLAMAVTSFADDSAARDEIIRLYGQSGLIELAYAMNGAVLLPGVKRALGYATNCDIDLLSSHSG